MNHTREYTPAWPWRARYIDRIEREQVTSSMVERAMRAHCSGPMGRLVLQHQLTTPEAWDRTRRNIAIGIAAGSYKP